MLVLGLLLIVVAVIVAVAAVFGNAGAVHAFSVLGYHLNGPTGTVFFYGVIVGAVGLFGLGLVLGSAKRSARRGKAARRGLKQSRKETAQASRDRDQLIDQRDAARAEGAGVADVGAKGSRR